MSIAMVGPFPGPFNREHYSDSNSDSLKETPQGRPRSPAPSQSRPRSAAPERDLSKPVPHDSVPYSPALPDSATPMPACPPTYPGPSRPAESQHDAPSPRPRIATRTKRRCYELLWRLVAVGAATVVVGLLVVVLRFRGQAHPKLAPVRGPNVNSGVNASRGSGNGTASPSASPSKPSAAEEQGRPGHSTGAVPGEPKETRRGQRELGEALDALPWSSTRELTGPTAFESRARVAPRNPMPSGGNPEPAPRASGAPYELGPATDADTAAGALPVTSTPAPRARELAATSSVGKRNVGEAHSVVGLERGLEERRVGPERRR